MILPGLLEPIWENISAIPPKDMVFQGQRISVPGNHLKIFVAVDSKKQAHFLISLGLIPRGLPRSYEALASLQR